MASTFSAFYVAKSGIQAANYNLKVTGQNIANVNTEGYTRQRVDAYAVGSSGNNMRYSNKTDLGIGEGTECTGVSQMRDPFLDVRYRMEHAKTGETDTELTTLNDLESVFDETDTDGINAQFSDLVKQLSTLAGTPSDTSLENIVKNSSLLLTKAFNNAAEQLSKIRTQQTDSFQTDAVDKVNTILQNIAHINQEIKSSDVSQTPALELIDQRNAMLDDLSQYVDIQTSTKSVPVGAGRMVDELSVNLVSPDGSKINLVDNDKYNQFDLTIKQDGDPEDQAQVTISLNNANGVELADNSGNPLLTNSDVTSGAFGGYLSMLNDNGEFDAKAAVPADPSIPTDGSPAVAPTARGIGYYAKTLDKLAGEFAQMMNSANSTNTEHNNKPLFTTDDGTTTDLSKITAANISISNAWNKSTGSYITATKEETLSGVDNSAAGKNILYMVYQFSKDTTFTTAADNSSAGTTLFKSSIGSFVSDISTTLGLQIDTLGRQNDTYTSTLNDIDTQRAAISSVDVNEEGINLIMYNQALTASSRFMTTMDEAVDTIINKMGRVGN